MDTLRLPDIRMPSVGLSELLADVLLIAGFVQMVLGICEMGGLFNPRRGIRRDVGGRGASRSPR